MQYCIYVHTPVFSLIIKGSLFTSMLMVNNKKKEFVNHLSQFIFIFSVSE